jgi:flagella basal body P-ring formation protein FlgA
MVSPIRIVLMAILSLLLTQAGGASADVLELKAEAVVQGDTFCLEEIATIHPGPVIPAETMARVEIGEAPRAGEKLVVSRKSLIQALGRKGFATGNIQLSGAAETVIIRASQTISAGTVHNLVRQHIMAHMPWSEKDAEIHQIRGARDFIMPTGKLYHRVIPQQNTDYLGVTPFQVISRAENGDERQQWVTAEIRVSVPVVIARHPVERLTHIGPADVKIDRRNLASLSSDTTASVEQVIGKRTRRKIRAGEPVRLSQIELPPVVKRGDLVTLRVETSSFLLTAKGKVLENGRPGETVRVENIASRKEIYGKVVDGTTLTVDF